MPKIRYSNKAVEDLSSIWEYTFTEWSESQADEYDEITDGLLGVTAGHHLIFYNIMDNGDVMVIRILHEKMDIKRHLPTK